MLNRDDWELTLREMQSQRNQLLLQMEMNKAIIAMVEQKIELLPKKKDEPKYKPNF